MRNKNEETRIRWNGSELVWRCRRRLGPRGSVTE